jgi:hypothetical protein
MFESGRESALEQYLAGRAENEVAREASGCEVLFREADEIEARADELHDRICETRASSLAGVLAQLELMQEEAGGTVEEQLIHSITAGVRALLPAER